MVYAGQLKMLPRFFYTIYLEENMKRKITYLLKDFDEMMREVLLHTKDIKTQVEYMKNKKEIFEEVDKMMKKYDKIINEIIVESEEEYEI